MSKLTKIIGFVVISITLFAAIYGGIYYFEIGAQPSVTVISAETNAENKFSVTLAKASEEHAKGLMEVKNMPKDEGMFFIFKDTSRRAFWMKNTYIPLDIIFINDSGYIIHIDKNREPLDENPKGPKGDVKAVLEINGGLSDVLGIKQGDSIKHKIFKK
jgi:hypothetical protein